MTEATWELALRTFGGVLQLAGFIMLAAGITAARRRWDPDRPGIVGTVGRAVDRLLGRPPEPITGTVVMTEAADIAVSAGTVVTDVMGKRSLEQRVTALEARSERHDEGLTQLQRDLAGEQVDREAADTTEQRAREEAVKRLDETVVELATGDLREEAIGVFVFLVGVVLTTWSPELAGVLP